MSPVTCNGCHKLLPGDAAYCPACGTPVPDGPTAFVFESATDDNTDLFVKPRPEAPLGWGPIVAGLAALLLVAAIVVTINGTGSDVAMAPTPVPASADPPATPETAANDTVYSAQPDQTPTEQTPTEQDADQRLADAAAGDASAEGSDPINRRPAGFVEVEAGSSVDEYVDAFTTLAKDYGVQGTIVFAAADAAVRIDLDSGDVATIPLDGRQYRLGARTGVISAEPGRAMIAQRWDVPDTQQEIDIAVDVEFVGQPWLDPNGWEVVPFFDWRSGTDGGYVAPWATTADGTHAPVKSFDDTSSLGLGGPLVMDGLNPVARWTWDDGPIPLDWDEILAANNGHYLVRECDDPGECRQRVVDDDGSVVVNVATSLTAGYLDERYLVLSTEATVAAFGPYRPDGPDDFSIALEIINLRTGTNTPVSTFDSDTLREIAVWLGDALLVIPLAAKSSNDTVYRVFDRNGLAVADLVWPVSVLDSPSFSYFAPDD